MYQYKFTYRNWGIAADFTGPISEIYLEDLGATVLIYEGAGIPNAIEFFEILDTSINKYESEKDAAILAYARNPADRDDIPF